MGPSEIWPLIAGSTKLKQLIITQNVEGVSIRNHFFFPFFFIFFKLYKTYTLQRYVHLTSLSIYVLLTGKQKRCTERKKMYKTQPSEICPFDFFVSLLFTHWYTKEMHWTLNNSWIMMLKKIKWKKERQTCLLKCCTEKS